MMFEEVGKLQAFYIHSSGKLQDIFNVLFASIGRVCIMPVVE